MGFLDLHRDRARHAAVGIGYLLVYLAADAAAQSHVFNDAAVIPWNAASAISFGLAGRYGLRWLPWTGLAPLLAGIGGGTADFGRMAVEMAACAVGAGLLRPAGEPFGDRMALPAVFRLFAAALAAAAVMALPSALAWTVGDPWKAGAVLAFSALSRLVANLAVAPLILLLPVGRSKGLVRQVTIETVLQALALAVIAWEVFGRFANEEVHFFYLLFLPLAWIATRHGVRGAATALAALYAAPVASDLLSGHHVLAIVELQIRLGVLAMTGLLLGAMVSERRSAEARVQARQTELAHFQRLNVGWEMASALAHELNQPLTAAMNYTQAGLRLIRAPSPDIARADAVIGKAVDQIERVGQTVHGLRDFMRKGEVRLAANDTREMVEDAVRLVSAEANAAGVALHAVGLAGLPPVMADKTQVVQVLVNLLRNAVQALAMADRHNPTVLVAGKLSEGVVEVTVTDNGPGLAPEVAARLFEPFVTTKPAGMGLGLSISKSILEAHDSRLWAEAARHGGAVFHFTLPVAARGGD